MKWQNVNPFINQNALETDPEKVKPKSFKERKSLQFPWLLPKNLENNGSLKESLAIDRAI